MANMSHCRFQNTLIDFRDCAATINAMINEDAEPLSVYELRAAKNLVHEAYELLLAMCDTTGLELGSLECGQDMMQRVQRIAQAREDDEDATDEWEPVVEPVQLYNVINAGLERLNLDGPMSYDDAMAFCDGVQDEHDIEVRIVPAE
jgi:hypothetical protein